MSVDNPAYQIPRQSIDMMEGMWAKMFDPPTVSPPTPDEIAPTNPVPEVMAAAGLQNTPRTAHTVERDLLHGDKLDAWDGKEINFMLIRDGDNPAAVGTFPGPTLRVPRGVIFHSHTEGHGPPPHTIHWHGIEPTPMNDGVGHCSMEIGDYTYQWQPNFIGFYFYHCHRNTVQHFEFGLYGALLIGPPDTYFATLWNPAIPIGACRDGKFRIACNLQKVRLANGSIVDVSAQYPGFNANLLTAADPEKGNPNSVFPDSLKFDTDPHAMTVPYDVEALWVLDDRDSRWSDLAKDARSTYPQHGDVPGVNDNFAGNAGGGLGDDDFFSFNDFNADYWYVTGVNVPGPKGGEAAIPAGIEIPPALICGTRTQVSIEAHVGQTILLRCLDAAYDCIDVRLPVDATIIGWDGRALGVPPYGEYNSAYVVPAGTVIHQSVARRWDALIKVTPDMVGQHEATVEFIDNEGQVHDAPGYDHVVLFTAKIPINIAAAPVTSTVSGTVTDAGAPLAGVTIAVTGAATSTAITDGNGDYSLALGNGNYTLTPSLAGKAFTPASLDITVADGDLPGQDFATVEAAGTMSISGQMVDSVTGVPVSGVQVNLVGAYSGTVITDVFGNYSFAGLPDGRYTIIPSHSGYRFTPRSRKASVKGNNVIGQVFRGRKL